MIYITTVPHSVYQEWKSYQDWGYSDRPMFSSYLKEQYAEYVISVDFTDRTKQNSTLDRVITFKSEAHYTWFLLQQ